MFFFRKRLVCTVQLVTNIKYSIAVKLLRVVRVMGPAKSEEQNLIIN